MCAADSLQAAAVDGEVSRKAAFLETFRENGGFPS